ncbi:MAG: flavodoxin-dependent (E)-4-hydroxy-3-methylbut-2-enyl-diphosphate synthase [Desulfomonilaceae bacterium]
MNILRHKTKVIRLGNLTVGGESEISVQSMTNTDTRDVNKTLRQIRRLEKAGCEIIRVGVPDMEAARGLRKIKAGMTVPLVADIHFDHKLALEALKQGVDGLRLNPGNIGTASKVREVTRAALERSVPIRIGVNSGSIEKKFLQRYGGGTPEAMVESALGHIAILEKADFKLIKVSLKASDVTRTIDAYRMLSARVDYPLHVGVTEAGTLVPGCVKSAVGIGVLLAEGIGDTIRVSLSAPPEREVEAGFAILRSLELRRWGVDLISCPTCSRTAIDLLALATKVEKAVSGIRTPLRVAVMGCVVNGPGEAKEADVGIAGGKGRGILFKKGQVVGTYEEKDLLRALLDEIQNMTLAHSA